MYCVLVECQVNTTFKHIVPDGIINYVINTCTDKSGLDWTSFLLKLQITLKRKTVWYLWLKNNNPLVQCFGRCTVMTAVLQLKWT